MSSEGNHRKPDIADAGPPSAGRGSARLAAAWGPSRGALAAVRNLEALLRNHTVPARTIADLIPELRTSAATLRSAIQSARVRDGAAARVGEHGLPYVAELEALLGIQAGPKERSGWAQRVGTVAGQLEAAIDLLALLDLAAAPVPTDVTLDLVAREVGRMSGTAHGREVVVRFDEAVPDCPVTVDPYVLGPLLSLLVGYVRAAGVDALVVRARATPGFVVETAVAADATLPTLSIRVMPWIAPSQLAAIRVAEQVGAKLEFEVGRGAIALRATPHD